MSRNEALARALATFGGLGDRLVAPGTTVGSFPVALLWLGMCVAIPTNPARLAATKPWARKAPMWRATVDCGQPSTSTSSFCVVCRPVIRRHATSNRPGCARALKIPAARLTSCTCVVIGRLPVPEISRARCSLERTAAGS